MSSDFTREPCIKFESSFDHSKLEKAQFTQTYDDGSSKKKKCPIFNGDNGIEALLYVEDRFNSICRQLQYTDGDELFDNFAEVVAGKAEDKWETLTVNIAPQDRTPQRFREVMDTFYLSYCDEEARDTMFKYLRKWKKNFKSEAGEHADRMETLVRYANRLPGLEPQLNDDQIKLLIFESFPVKWQHAFIQSGRRIANEPLAKVVQYMKDEKSFLDIAHKNKRRRDDDGGSNSYRGPYRGRGRGRNQNRSGRGRGRDGNNYGNVCKLHGGHDWADCFDNPNGRNYMPNRNRGGGRGFQRGRGQWRGGRGDRSNNYGNRNNNSNYYGQSNQNQQRESYHNEVPRQVSNSGDSTLSSRTNNNNNTNNSARGAPPSEYAQDGHCFDLVPYQSGSAWSTGGDRGGNRRVT